LSGNPLFKAHVVPDGFSIAPVSGDLRYEMTGEVADMLKLSHSVFAGNSRSTPGI
jgi:hypothetical protein